MRTTSTVAWLGSSVNASLRDDERQQRAEREHGERVDEQRSPVRERRAQAGAERRRRPCVLEHDERRREPQREDRRQREHAAGSASTSAAGRSRSAPRSSARRAASRRLAPSAAGAVVARHEVDQHAAVEQRRQRSTAAVMPATNTMPSGISARRFARNPWNRCDSAGRAAALLRPRRGEQADGEHRLQQRHAGLCRRTGSASAASIIDVVEREQHEPRQARAAEHRVRVDEPREAAARAVTREDDVGRAGPVCSSRQAPGRGSARHRSRCAARGCARSAPGRARASARRGAAGAGRRGATARSAARPRAAASAIARARRRRAGARRGSRRRTRACASASSAPSPASHQSLTAIARS